MVVICCNNESDNDNDNNNRILRITMEIMTKNYDTTTTTINSFYYELDTREVCWTVEFRSLEYLAWKERWLSSVIEKGVCSSWPRLLECRVSCVAVARRSSRRGVRWGKRCLCTLLNTQRAAFSRRCCRGWERNCHFPTNILSDTSLWAWFLDAIFAMPPFPWRGLWWWGGCRSAPLGCWLRCKRGPCLPSSGPEHVWEEPSIALWTWSRSSRGQRWLAMMLMRCAVSFRLRWLQVTVRVQSPA